MSQKAIRAKLTVPLAAYAAAHNPALRLNVEGESFTKPVDGSTFLEVFLVPANTIVSTLAGNKRRFFGDFQINVWTKDGVGTATGETIAEEIAQLFPVLPKSTFTPVSIEAPASIKRAITDTAGWRVIPVCLSYRAEF